MTERILKYLWDNMMDHYYDPLYFWYGDGHRFLSELDKNWRNDAYPKTN